MFQTLKERLSVRYEENIFNFSHVNWHSNQNKEHYAPKKVSKIVFCLIKTLGFRSTYIPICTQSAGEYLLDHTNHKLACTVYTQANTNTNTDLGDKGTLVSLPHRKPHQGIPQSFDLLVVIQPFHLPLQITWKHRDISVGFCGSCEACVLLQLKENWFRITFTLISIVHEHWSLMNTLSYNHRP